MALHHNRLIFSFIIVVIIITNIIILLSDEFIYELLKNIYSYASHQLMMIEIIIKNISMKRKMNTKAESFRTLSKLTEKKTYVQCRIRLLCSSACFSNFSYTRI